MASTQHKTPLPTVAEDVGRFGNAYYRWTLLYAVLIFVIATWPLWMTIIAPDVASIANSLVLVVFAAVWVSIAFNALNNMRRMETVPLPSVEGLQASRERTFTHIVVVPCYLDPLEVLFDSLGSLLMQANVKSLLVVVAFEAKTPDLTYKQDSVKQAFQHRFQHLLITTHTVDRACEIAGGCSNKNYALRSAYAHIQSEPGVYATAHHAITVTTCDTDSLFHPNYFTVLEMVYNAKNSDLAKAPVACVWQSPLFYNWDLDARPFFNRVTCLMRSMMMLGGLIAFNLNPMSVFSYPLELGLQAGFINPRYGVDDIIAKVRWMCATNSAVPIELLPIPSISGPTIGTSMLQEYEEWARQIRRWIIGSSESFHYFVIHFRGQPALSGLSWFAMFFMYYAVLLCCAGINSLLAGIPWPWITYTELSLSSTSGGPVFSLSYAGFAFLILQYIVFGVAFYLDHRAKQLMCITETKMTLTRNLLHWLSAPWVLLWYSIIAFCSILAFTWKGKKMARHDMAAKEGLEKKRNDVENVLHRIDGMTPADADASDSDTNGDAEAVGEDEEPSLPRNHTSRSVSNSNNVPAHITALATTTTTTTDTNTNSNSNTNRPLYAMPDKFFFGQYCHIVTPAHNTA